MDSRLQPDPARQALGRNLTNEEVAFAEAMQKAFASGVHDPESVAQALEKDRIARPSGRPGAWSGVVLEQELRRINSSLDEAYTTHGRERLC